MYQLVSMHILRFMITVHIVAALWPGPVVLQSGDRIGFVRNRKVGSTTLAIHMRRHLLLCVSQCDRPDAYCRTCLYGTRCGICANDTSPNFKFTAGDANESAIRSCYPCNHVGPARIRMDFDRSVIKRRPDTFDGKLYLVTLLRDPVDRFISGLSLSLFNIHIYTYILYKCWTKLRTSRKSILLF